MIGAHPDVLYIHEPSFVVADNGVCDLAAGDVSLDVFRTRMLGHHQPVLRGKLRNSPWADGLYTNAVVGWLLSESFDQGADVVEGCRAFCEAVFGLGAVRADKRHWIDKTPLSVLRAGWLHMLFPDMRFIHILRNPRDVCASLVRQKWFVGTIQTAAEYCSHVLGAALAEKAKVPRENYLAVEFESLVAVPEREMRRVMEFLGVPYDSACLTPAEGKPEADKANMGRWKAELSAGDLRTIDSFCASVYERWRREAVVP